MMNKEFQSQSVLPIDTQSIYFVLIACIYFLGLDAFGLSFINMLPFSVSIGRIFLSYLGVIILLYCLFYPYAGRSFYQKITPFLWMVALIVLTIIFIFFLNDEVRSYLRTFDSSTPVFIGVHTLMLSVSYIWVGLFITAYLGNDEKITKRTIVLTFAIGPLLVYALFWLLLNGTTLLIISLELNLYSWPLWLQCFIASFAILLVANIVIYLNHFIFNRNATYKVIVVIGFILSISLFVYMASISVFEKYFMMLYFDFPGFIK